MGTLGFKDSDVKSLLLVNRVFRVGVDQIGQHLDIELAEQTGRIGARKCQGGQVQHVSILHPDRVLNRGTTNERHAKRLGGLKFKNRRTLPCMRPCQRAHQKITQLRHDPQVTQTDKLLLARPSNRRTKRDQ